MPYPGQKTSATKPRGMEDVPIQSRDCRWVWAQLTETPADDATPLKLLIPETVFFANGEAVTWLCSSAQECIEKRSPRAELSLLAIRRKLLRAAHASMATLADTAAAAAGGIGGSSLLGTSWGGEESGFKPTSTGARTAAAAAAIAATDMAKLSTPPFSAIARRTVKGGDVRGFLLDAATLREALVTGVGLSTFSLLQAYVHPKSGPGHRVRCQLEVGMDGHSRCTVFALDSHLPLGAFPFPKWQKCPPPLPSQSHCTHARYRCVTPRHCVTPILCHTATTSFLRQNHECFSTLGSGGDLLGSERSPKSLHTARTRATGASH
ncbi:hypothetical protein T492DRAFT_370034 [Pavlovales sp. CCMP2436]|nr:hypothetical protein T492DRAFT_370034 [Pavlovales sp. CCMP2436]